LQEYPKQQNNNTMAKKKQPAPTRQTYTADQREAARKMYLRGLYLTEISVLLQIPVRTLEKWQTAEKWTLLKGGEEIHKRAFEMKQSGKTAVPTFDRHKILFQRKKDIQGTNKRLSNKVLGAYPKPIFS